MSNSTATITRAMQVVLRELVDGELRNTHIIAAGDRDTPKANYVFRDMAGLLRINLDAENTARLAKISNKFSSGFLVSY